MKIKRLFRAILIAFTATLLGGIAYLLTPLDGAWGLDMLFQIRGKRPPPHDVVIVAMDERSVDRLGVWRDMTEWRGFHAKLIQELQRQGALLIVFDLQFMQAQPEHDPAFAEAIKRAGNVLVTACVQKQKSALDECSATNKDRGVQVENGKEDSPEYLVDMRVIPPVPLLSEAVLDHAPFFLPKDGSNPIREAWTFVDTLSETPTLPVLTWFYYLHRRGELANSFQASLPLSDWLAKQRRVCLFNLAKQENNLAKKSDLVRRIDQLICPDNYRYLDYYGPPKTLRMESYSDVYDGKVSDLKNKVIFVGKASRLYLPSSVDYFPTPFSDTSAGNMAGIEIMATQFANLVENRFLTSPLPPLLYLALFTLCISAALTLLDGIAGIAASLLLAAVYFGLAVKYFAQSGIWLPVAVPLLLQLPLSWLISVWWSRRDLLKERARIIEFIRRVFPQWLPLVTGTRGTMFPNKEKQKVKFRVDVFGVCLATDIEEYTRVAAHHRAHEMSELLNNYYQVLGHPVSSRQGIIANIAGDSMIALWNNKITTKQRLTACLSALEMKSAVEQFNIKLNNSDDSLKTRIGLYEGEMSLTGITAGDTTQYLAVGDTVNAASRVQGVNKLLGTQILATNFVVEGLEEIACRPVGCFLLRGRDEPTEVVEILGLVSSIDSQAQIKYDTFAIGLSAFRHAFWEDAVHRFTNMLENYGQDGPAEYYLRMALLFMKNPPENWTGYITLG